jgi:hypothetical protein
MPTQFRPIAHLPPCRLPRLYGNHRNGATSTSWSMGRTRGAPLYLLKYSPATLGA